MKKKNATIAALALVTLVAGLVALTRAGDGAPQQSSLAAAATTSPSPSSSPAATAGWVVDVSLEPARVGPLALSVGDVGPAGPGWRSHVLTLRNAGERGVSVTHDRQSAFVRDGDDRVLLVADEGCGYAPGPPARAGACSRYLDAFRLGAGDAETRRITLMKGLRGMSSLREGRYVFHKTLEVGGRAHEVRIVYDLGRA